MRQIFSYIDPGAGSILFQVLLGSLLSVFFFGRKAAKKIKAFFKKQS